VNEQIFSKKELVKEYHKARISERNKGYILSPMISGNRILADINYLNTEVRNQIDELIDESKISIEVEIDQLGERLLSNEPISPVLAKTLELVKKLEVKSDYVAWLKNELYGYLQYLNTKSDISEPKLMPNNPSYRRIPGEIRINFFNEETRRGKLERIDKPIFLSQPAAELESLLESTKNSSEFLFNFPISYFPKMKDELGKKKFPLFVAL
jgi:hypothetical protein